MRDCDCGADEPGQHYPGCTSQTEQPDDLDPAEQQYRDHYAA